MSDTRVGSTVYVVTQGCGYGGERDTVLGVFCSNSGAEEFCTRWWEEHGARINRDCPLGQAVPEVSALEVQL